MQYRTLGRTIRAAANPDYYLAALRTLSCFDRPWTVLSQYLGIGRARYPQTLTARNRGRQASLDVYCADDVVTAVECFGKLDYAVPADARCIVDFGSNIGISLLYFLLHAPNARVHAFEPDPRNIERLHRNLRGFESRYRLEPVAIGTRNGQARFGREPTGRYGGLGLDLPDQIEVEVRDVNQVLSAVLDTEDRIDLLKIDVEGQEHALLEALRTELLPRIGRIAVEIAGTPPELPGFVWTRRGGVVTFVPR